MTLDKINDSVLKIPTQGFGAQTFGAQTFGAQTLAHFLGCTHATSLSYDLLSLAKFTFVYALLLSLSNL